MAYKDQDLVKHSRNLPEYLQYGGNSANTQDKAYNFGVLDWKYLENWKSNRKRALKTSHDTTLESGSTSIPTSINKSNGKQAEQMMTSEGETSFRDSRKYRSQHSSHYSTRNHQSSTKMLSQENFDHDNDLRFNRHEDVLFSHSRPSSSHDHQLSDSRKSCDGNLNGLHEKRLYGCFLEDHIDTLNPSTEVPQSFPYDVQDSLLKGEDCLNFDPIIKGKHTSLSRRLSFSLEKKAKSFSFNSISAFQQLSSTYKSLKSGSVTLGLSLDLHNFNSKKENATNLVRFISMKRLVNPLLKHKRRHLAEKIHQSNRNLLSSSNDEIQKSSNVLAILHLTMKNGIPLFKLETDSNNSNILVATVKRLPSGKDDSSLTYTFHSANEIKKNSKGYCFDYDIVGHMKISSSYHAEFSGLERDLYVVRESILYGPDCMLTGELAAIIVKNTSKENSGGIGSSKSTVVILPGGSHSVPNSGQPSSLINRWKSGGVCDCGGWDVGCELGILTNQDQPTEVSRTSISDRLDLCYQGRHTNKHDFSLVTLENGLYSLEYNASISLLQAFSISVAIVSSQNLTHMFQVNHLQDENGFIKPLMTRHQKVKSQTIVHAKVPPVSPIGRV